MARMLSQNEPLTRSRTSLFLSYRDSAVRPPSTPATPYPRYYEDDYDLDNEEAGLLVPGGSSGEQIRRGSATVIAGARRASGAALARRGNAAGLPPRWVDLADKVDELIVQIKPKIAQLDKLHAKHLLPGFKDRTAEEREVEALATAITSDFRACQSHIRFIAEQSQTLLASRPASAADAELKRIDLIMAANVQTALATKVQELSTGFRKKQADYLRQLKGNESRAVERQAKSTYDPLVSLADDEQAQQLFSSPSTTSTSAIDQRTNEIHNIAQSIADLADMFKDLSSLVIDQGTLLDRVDYNVEQMSTDVKGAVQELQQATRYQRRSGKCQLIFLLVLAILACIIFLTFRPPRLPSSISATYSPATSTGDGRASTEEIAQAISDELSGGARRRSTAEKEEGAEASMRRGGDFRRALDAAEAGEPASDTSARRGGVGGVGYPFARG
ncbi:t-SNARE affecting a late Golgi compartment protein 2 [Rhodotorula toruloides]